MNAITYRWSKYGKSERLDGLFMSSRYPVEPVLDSLPRLTTAEEAAVIQFTAENESVKASHILEYELRVASSMHLLDIASGKLELKNKGILAVTLQPAWAHHSTATFGGAADAQKAMDRLTGHVAMWLMLDGPEGLHGRFVDATWDMSELVAREEEIVANDLLKPRAGRKM